MLELPGHAFDYELSGDGMRVTCRGCGTVVLVSMHEPLVVGLTRVVEQHRECSAGLRGRGEGLGIA